MPRRTKIVATLGPSTDDPKVLDEMIQAGVDVVRVNFSHGTHEEHIRRAEQVRTAIQTVSDTTESNAASAEQLAASAEQLGAQAQTLQDLVGRFEL